LKLAKIPNFALIKKKWKMDPLNVLLEDFVLNGHTKDFINSEKLAPLSAVRTKSFMALTATLFKINSRFK